MIRPTLTGDTATFDEGRGQRMSDLGDHITGLDDTFAHERIAEAAAARLLEHGGKPGGFRWQPTNPDTYLGAVRRTDYQREKINLSQPQFEKTWTELNTLVGQAGGADIRQIGDSLFLVEPSAS